MLLPDGAQAALFRLDDGTVHAVGNIDPFSGAAVMSRGIVGDRGGRATVQSPIKKQAFALDDGICLDDPTVAVPVYQTRITADGRIVGSRLRVIAPNRHFAGKRAMSERAHNVDLDAGLSGDRYRSARRNRFAISRDIPGCAERLGDTSAPRLAADPETARRTTGMTPPRRGVRHRRRSLVTASAHSRAPGSRESQFDAVADDRGQPASAVVCRSRCAARSDVPAAASTTESSWPPAGFDEAVGHHPHVCGHGPSGAVTVTVGWPLAATWAGMSIRT